MEQNITSPLCYCSRCRQNLPAEAFYMEHGTCRRDRYCIDCRKELNRIRYQKSHYENECRKYPVITETSDPALRIALIILAQRKVNESMERKRKRRHETEYRTEPF